MKKLVLCFAIPLILVSPQQPKQVQAADITIHIDDANYQADLEDFAFQNNYQRMVQDPDNPGTQIPNPEKLDKFLNRKITEFIIGNGVAAQVNSKIQTFRDQTIIAAKAQYADIVTSSVSQIVIKPPK